MTDRHAGYIITLDHDLREDDAETTVSALRQIKGVLDVTPVIADASLAIARTRAFHDARSRVLEVLEDLQYHWSEP